MKISKQSLKIVHKSQCHEEGTKISGNAPPFTTPLKMGIISIFTEMQKLKKKKITTTNQNERDQNFFDESAKQNDKIFQFFSLRKMN